LVEEYEQKNYSKTASGYDMHFRASDSCIKNLSQKPSFASYLFFFSFEVARVMTTKKSFDGFCSGTEQV